MTKGIAIGLVLFGIAQAGIGVSAYFQWIIIAEVNRKLSDEEQISYFFGYLGKYDKVDREYRRLYPSGRYIMFSRLAFLVGALFMLAAFGVVTVFHALHLDP